MQKAVERQDKFKEMREKREKTRRGNNKLEQATWTYWRSNQTRVNLVFDQSVHLFTVWSQSERVGLYIPFPVWRCHLI
jgi:hypothetical protein